MKKHHPKVDEYIEKSVNFAKPILTHLRKLIVDTCPEVEESIKWGTPHYSYKGDHLCMMAGFKNHCSFSLYKAELMQDKAIQDSVKAGKKFGYMDKVKALTELPSQKVLVTLLKEAMKINETGTPKPRPTKEKPPAELVVPAAFTNALKKNAKALSVWQSKSPSFQKEYSKWIAEAKTEETRTKRIDQALEWIADGKSRFWQYQK